MTALAPPKADNRSRLLEGLAQSLREKGLQRTQISDVVRRARTSRRTFYECFPDKESAFVELIDELRTALHARVQEAVDPQAPWDEQIDRAIDAYFAALADDSALATTVSRELPALGERGAALHHETVDRFAQLVVGMTGGPAMRRAGVRRVTRNEAVMLMGGVAELIARAMQGDLPLSRARTTVKAVIKAAIEPRPPGASPRRREKR
jgi:AcrR family transcriptional regulator